MSTKIHDLDEHSEDSSGAGRALPVASLSDRHECENEPYDPDAFRGTGNRVPLMDDEDARRADLTAPDPDGAARVARECGVSPDLVAEILLCAAEQDALPLPASSGRSVMPAETQKWRELTAILIKIMDYTRPPSRPGKDEFDVLSTIRVRRYAVLHAFDKPQFDTMNGNLNTQEFAATVILLKTNLVRDPQSKKMVVRRTEKPLTKAAVNNAVLDAQKHFGLPPRKDQRNEATRAKQSRVRKGQLAPAALDLRLKETITLNPSKKS